MVCMEEGLSAEILLLPIKDSCSMPSPCGTEITLIGSDVIWKMEPSERETDLNLVALPKGSLFQKNCGKPKHAEPHHEYRSIRK
jgi:hypothetical protein